MCKVLEAEWIKEGVHGGQSKEGISRRGDLMEHGVKRAPHLDEGSLMWENHTQQDEECVCMGVWPV